MVGLLGLIGWKGYRNLIKFYSLDAYSEYGNEHPSYCKISSVEKEYPELNKKDAVLEASKKMMLPILILS